MHSWYSWHDHKVKLWWHTKIDYITKFRWKICNFGSSGANQTKNGLKIMAQLHDEHNLKSCHNLHSFQLWQKRFLALVLQEYEALEKNKTLMTFPVVAANATNMFLFPCHSSIYLSPSIAHMASVTRFGKISLLW